MTGTVDAGGAGDTAGIAVGAGLTIVEGCGATFDCGLERAGIVVGAEAFDCDSTPVGRGDVCSVVEGGTVDGGDTTGATIVGVDATVVSGGGGG